MTALQERSEATLVEKLTLRLEQLLSDPEATSSQVINRLFEGGLLRVQLPAESLHRLLVQALSEGVENEGRDWLARAVERFLERLANVASV